MSRQGSYFLDTRHPWPCLLFLLPLLIAYEVGVLWVGGPNAQSLRGGVDSCLRWTLMKFGLRQLYIVPAIIALVFVIWSWLRREERPSDLGGTLLGMTLESVVFALVLYGISACLNSVLADDSGGEPAQKPAIVQPAPPPPPAHSSEETSTVSEAIQQVVMFVGAGIYEEVVFRLVLFTAVLGLLRLLQAPMPLGPLVAAVVSAAVFAAAHHVGPYGEPFAGGVFVFRLLAGLYFAMLFHVRGFGVVVGAHAIYDILAGFSSS